jgi:membrane protein DedA with SNARE-associated domain
MPLEHLILLFGYPLIIAGSFIEGEMILILGGFAAHQGYLSLSLVILCAFIGAFSGDQFFFWLGRHKSQAFLQRHPDWNKRISVIQRRLERFQIYFVIGFRFIYGLRTISPFVIGMGDFPTNKFIMIDIATVFAWAALVGTLGFLFGNAMEILLGHVEHYEMELFGAISIVGLVVWMIRTRKKRIY